MALNDKPTGERLEGVSCTGGSANECTGNSAGQCTGEALARRKLLKLGLYSAPAILGTLLVSREASAKPPTSCPPNSCKPAPCKPHPTPKASLRLQETPEPSEPTPPSGPSY